MRDAHAGSPAQAIPDTPRARQSVRTGRVLVGELMDDPALGEAEHRAALAGLARLNTLARASAAIVCRLNLPALAKRVGGTVRILDAAAGSADLAVAIAARARTLGVDAKVTACDISPVALAAAKERAASAGVDLELLQADLISKDSAADAHDERRYDAVVNTLFLHHLTDADAARVLRRFADLARHTVVVGDLVRSRRGLLLSKAIPRLVTRSPVVHTDAVRSVRAAFTIDELRGLCDQAGLRGATVSPSWPERAVIRWDAP